MASPDPYEGIRQNSQTPGSFDIVKNYDWTSVPRNRKLRDEAPSAYITAYELKYSQLKQFIGGYMNIFSPRNSSNSYKDSNNPGLDFYKGLYSVARTPLARFSFPFFSDEMRSFSTEFDNTFSPISQRNAQMLGGDMIMGAGGAAESLVGGAVATGRALGDVNIGGMALQDVVTKGTNMAMKGMNKVLGTDMKFNPGTQTVGAPGTYIETPQFYQYSNTDSGVQISFTLSNTLNDDGFDLNYNFITNFTKLNRPFRRGPIGMNFPAIYNLVIPGVRFIQWASLENFQVSMLGSRRKIYKKGSGEIIVPEAYVCDFNFKSLTLEPSNFVDEISQFSDGFAGYSSDRGNFESEIADYRADQEEKLKQQQREGRARDEQQKAIENYNRILENKLEKQALNAEKANNFKRAEEIRGRIESLKKKI